MIDEFLQLPVFPQNYVDQLIFFEMLKTAAQNMTNDAFANNSTPIQVSSSTTPNQSQWEAAWIAKGFALPISPSAILIWWNSSTNVVGGSFGSTPTSGGLVYSRDTLNPPGGVNAIFQAFLNTSISSNVSLGVTNTNHPSIIFTLNKLSDVYLMYSISTTLVSGTGQWGADFLFDGEKVGTKHYALPTNIGLAVISVTGPILAFARVPNVAPGSHKVQAMMGVCNSPVTPPVIAYGGTIGMRLLKVEAVTL